MATIRVTHSGSTTDPVYIREFYTSVPVGGFIETERAASELPTMAGLQAALTAGTVTLTVTYSADELGSGLQSPPNAVEAADMADVAATAVESGLVMIHKSFAAGGGGSPDDVTIYAVDNLPFKCRVLDVHAFITTPIGASTLEVRDEAGGSGTVVGTLDSAASARVTTTAPVSSTVLTPSATKGLFVRRSDDGVAGEVMILVRKES